MTNNRIKKIMIQFHATSEEIIAFLNSLEVEFKLVMTIMNLRPFAVREIVGDLSADELNVDGGIRIIITANKPLIDANSPNHFYDLNEGTIGLHYGRMTNKGLEESSLAFMSNDKEKAAVAAKVASRLKKMTKNGAIAVNQANGAEAAIPSHRYTAGAKTAFERGVIILPAAGNSIIKLGDT